jgi:hypothetical protein
METREVGKNKLNALYSFEDQKEKCSRNSFSYPYNNFILHLNEILVYFP